MYIRQRTLQNEQNKLKLYNNFIYIKNIKQQNTNKRRIFTFIKDYIRKSDTIYRTNYEKKAQEKALENTQKLKQLQYGDGLQDLKHFERGRVKPEEQEEELRKDSKNIYISPRGHIYRCIQSNDDDISKISSRRNIFYKLNPHLVLERDINTLNFPTNISPDIKKIVKDSVVQDPWDMKRQALGRRTWSWILKRIQNSNQTLIQEDKDINTIKSDIYNNKSIIETNTDEIKINELTQVKKKNIQKILKYLHAHYILTKPNVSIMVMATTWWGYGLGQRTISDQYIPDFLAQSIGTLGLAISASIINQILEKDIDNKMIRTASRPIVNGTISVNQAIVQTILYGSIGGTILYTINPLACIIGICNVILYGGIYTLMKRVTIYNTEIGSIVGSLPPIMGYIVSLPNDVPQLYDPIALFWPASMMFTWQMQHVMLIFLRRSEDYNNAGFIMQCLNDPGLQTTRSKGVAWTVATFALTFIPYYFNYTELSSIMIVYLWGLYTIMYTTGAFSLKPRQDLLRLCLILGYIILFLTMFISVVTKSLSKDDFSKLQLNRKPTYGSKQGQDHTT